MIATHKSTAGVEETRARILAAAREIFEKHGTRGTTTREVAERAGVNEATLFRHFGSKAALLGAMRESSCAFEEFRSVVSSVQGEDLGRDLHAIANAMVGNMVDQRNLMCISLAEDSLGTADLDTPEWRGPSQSLQLLAGYFADRKAEGRVRGEPDMLARAFLGFMFQYVVARKLWQSQTIDPATIDFLVDLFLNGVRS